MQKRSNFIFLNEEFVCLNCGEVNPQADAGCRNHCRKCLFSLHLDEELPGDRASDCGGLMKPVGADKNSKKGFMVVHRCVDCGKEIRNKLAGDDNFDELINISSL